MKKSLPNRLGELAGLFFKLGVIGTGAEIIVDAGQTPGV